MKKMFLFFVTIIIAITLLFLLFSSDMNTLNRRFLEDFGIETEAVPIAQEEFTIPSQFDNIYENYNIIQLESGFDLALYKGEKAVRYTYKMLNFPNSSSQNIYANVICIKKRQIGGDICCTDIDGFILPLNFLKTNNFNQRPVMKYQIPAITDAPMP